MRIISGGSYVPYRRLDRATISEALGTPPAPGTRSVASYDEDATSMGVEAARNALANVPPELAPELVLFATSTPAYLDKTNATAIHAALGLDRSIAAFDVVGSVRSGMAAMQLAGSASQRTLVVRSDVRTGLPGGADERDGGDGAAAFLFAPAGADVPAQTTALGRGAATLEFLDRWRLPGEPASHVWEERFGEHAYVPLAQAAFTDACKSAGITPEDLDHVLVSGPHSRAVRVASKAIGVRPDALVDNLSATVGYTGAAHSGIALADVLETTEPGKKIGVLLLADGADALIFETTDALGTIKPRRTVAEQLAAGVGGLSYETFLTWRGMLDREPPRRPDPVAPAAPPSLRSEDWKFAFAASRCEACGERHLPPARVCAKCGSIDQMTSERMADVPATIATFTVDRLAFTPSPPLVAAVLDFDGGGRFRGELTDVDPAAVKVGDRIEMTFRRITTAQGVHNYFWKGKPAR
ncbi:MAG: hydroxymethylglutaryl-CoA synthase [Actinobacteria bacterium]|nr:hydroxymethylglutaryl-CoA synthase [Actinomycetota bacterium]